MCEITWNTQYEMPTVKKSDYRRLFLILNGGVSITTVNNFIIFNQQLIFVLLLNEFLSGNKNTKYLVIFYVHTCLKIIFSDDDPIKIPTYINTHLHFTAKGSHSVFALFFSKQNQEHGERLSLAICLPILNFNPIQWPYRV